MLFRRPILDAIAAGQVRVALRRWRRPTVKAGGRLRTEAGELAIDAVEAIDLDEVTLADARAAGFDARAQAIDDLQSQREGQVYRIRFHLAGADPRIALRENATLSTTDRDLLTAKLEKLDAGKAGTWTDRMLKLIAANEATPAGELATLGGYEKEWLKLNVRKLKNLGLTESLQPGYRISPRGRAWLQR